MSELPEQQQKVVDEAHAYRDAYNIREERREIYQIVAAAIISADINDKLKAADVAQLAETYAEAIYQGMIRFVGDKT